MPVLAIETSCDETAVALYDIHKGLLGHLIHSQIPLHQPHGGIVPELASRDHLQKLLPLIKSLLQQTHIKESDITGICYTAGPGLLGALLVGATLASSLAFAWNIPVFGVHHMEGHLLAPMLEDSKPEFPFLALLVSGGHTQLVAVNAFGDYTIMGESVDDACGEAFDKVAKMLGLPYPGGPQIAKLAESGTVSRFHFPRPMLDRPNLDFSFSGLKTHTLQLINQHQPIDEKTKSNIAAGFQEAVVDVLISKTSRALKETGFKQLVIAGGVSANQRLREKLSAALPDDVQTFFPRHEFCTDNAAMIAYVGAHRLQSGETTKNPIFAQAKWSIEDLPKLHNS